MDSLGYPIPTIPMELLRLHVFDTFQKSVKNPPHDYPSACIYNIYTRPNPSTPGSLYARVLVRPSPCMRGYKKAPMTGAVFHLSLTIKARITMIVRIILPTVTPLSGMGTTRNNHTNPQGCLDYQTQIFVQESNGFRIVRSQARPNSPCSHQRNYIQILPYNQKSFGSLLHIDRKSTRLNSSH